MLINTKALKSGDGNRPWWELTVDAAELITHILAVMLLVALAAAVNAGAVCTLELIRPARRRHWRAQGDGHEKHQSENVLC